MSFTRRYFPIFALSLSLLPSVAFAQDADELWEDFNHYVLVARPELAMEFGEALLDLDEDALLTAVESSDRKDLDGLFIRLRGMGEDEAELANKIESLIQKSKVNRAREVERIQADIELLPKGSRAYMNAVERLGGAGQYAAPHLLNTLLDDDKKSLHPFVMSAMVEIGRPMVYPLSVALPKLEPVPQGQIAQVLGEIGYPTALPYVQLVLENQNTDPKARSVAEAARTAILRNVKGSASLDAAELFYILGISQYGSEPKDVLGYDGPTGLGVAWEYTPRTGLVPIEVPGQIFSDVMAMRSAAATLSLTPDSRKALTLWTMANSRRENRLGDDEDPSYPTEMREASFYLKLAGPLRQHEVLARALADNDPALALDAIEALSDTAGTKVLVNEEGTIQPLLDALSFGDRRVRYHAAFALTNATPEAEFPGAYRVVPVLAQALRQSDQRIAVVLGNDQDKLNELQAALKELGYETIGGANLGQLGNQLKLVPGVDLIVTDLSANGVEQVYAQTLGDYKLSSVPILATGTEGVVIGVRNRFFNSSRVFVTTAAPDADEIGDAVDNAASSATGEPIEDDEATELALMSLGLLRDVAISSANVYNVVDAQPALELAVNDERDDVAIAAGAVLAKIGNAGAQSSIAAAALDDTRNEDVRLAMLASLAESGRAFGRLIDDRQTGNLQTLVQTSNDELAVSSAKAFGALVPSAPQAVELINSGR